MADKIRQLQKELGTIIKGKKEVTDKIIMAVLARGHVLLEDVPGVGKTTTALALCRLMGMDFNRIQFTPDVVPSDVTGFTTVSYTHLNNVYALYCTMEMPVVDSYWQNCYNFLIDSGRIISI